MSLYTWLKTENFRKIVRKNWWLQCVVLSFSTFLFDLFLVLRTCCTSIVAIVLSPPLHRRHTLASMQLVEERPHQSIPIDQDQLNSVHCASNTLRSWLNTGHRYCKAQLWRVICMQAIEVQAVVRAVWDRKNRRHRHLIDNHDGTCSLFSVQRTLFKSTNLV